MSTRYVAPPVVPDAPAVTSVTPTSGPLSGGTRVTIRGSNLADAISVQFDNAPAPQVTNMSSSELQAVAPAGLVPGRVDVTVTTPVGTSAPVSADGYVYGSVSSVDRTPPSVSIGSHPADLTNATSATIAFTASDPDNPASDLSTTCSLDAAAAASCSSPAGYSGLADGPHKVTIEAADPAGNTGSASFSWRVDTKPPVLILPANQTVDATDPSGAPVIFTANATDSVDGTDPVTCTPASGATFPIGPTTVKCSATDRAGNTATGAFIVTVNGATAQLTDLLAAVQGVGPGKSLAAKVHTAQRDLGSGNTSAGCSDLTAFISEVKAQTGKKIPAAQAQQLITDARRIQAVIGRC